MFFQTWESGCFFSFFLRSLPPDHRILPFTPSKKEIP
ncbi:hypothetical protein LEP1GSC115_5247, partial [Leptospira interrogans serovar Australis str. 200703203]